MTIKVTCTKGKITVYPETGIETSIGVELPLVTDPTGKSIILSEGESTNIAAAGFPAIGGKFLAGNSEFTVLLDGEGELSAVHWHEVDNDPIYADEEQGYIDLETGEHTDMNYTKIRLVDSKPYHAKVVTSNVLTLSIMTQDASIQPK